MSEKLSGIQALKKFLEEPTEWRTDYPKVENKEIIELKRVDPEGFEELKAAALAHFTE